jgi:adenylate kinase family enzyme
MESFPYQRIVVIGTTSSGKSTLAEQLAQKIGADFIELDALNWGPNWTPAGDELLRARVEEATRSPIWVVAGNYSKTRPVTWARAEVIIWLDYSLWVIFWRLWRRTWKRVFGKEELWNGNRENFWTHSNSGQTTRSFIGCSRPIGGAKRNIPNYFPSQNSLT